MSILRWFTTVVVFILLFLYVVCLIDIFYIAIYVCFNIIHNQCFCLWFIKYVYYNYRSYVRNTVFSYVRNYVLQFILTSLHILPQDSVFYWNWCSWCFELWSWRGCLGPSLQYWIVDLSRWPVDHINCFTNLDKMYNWAPQILKEGHRLILTVISIVQYKEHDH